MKFREWLIAALIAAGFALAGCMGPEEEFIQGTWEYNDLHLSQMAGEQHLTVVWFFSGGTFTYQSCCFNHDIEIAGRYRILEAGEDVITLELYNTRGSEFRLNTEIRIKIDRENQTLNIQGGGPFRKLGP